MALDQSILQKFDSWDKWELYSKQLEEYFEANNVLNDKQVAVLLAVLSPSVYRVLKESCHPGLPRLKTYAELSELLKIYNSREATVFKERVKFYEARQTADESVTEWLARVMNLAIPCEFDYQLDTMLRDNFTSGLADHRIVNRLCKESGKATLKHVVDIAVEMERSQDALIPKEFLTLKEYKGEQKGKISSDVCNILDIPDEILRYIILHLNARERVPLGNSCERFNNLIFKDRVLLRNLCFSKNAHLTSETDILPYFEDKSTWKYIRKIDLKNVTCMEPGPMLNYSIGKAITLVDVNVHGIQFKDVQQLGDFLEPLSQLKRLSVDWPKTTEEDIPLCCKVLQQSFNRLTYLSVKTSGIPWSREFIVSLQLCQVLKELVITKSSVKDDPAHIWNVEPKDLKNLEIVEYSGPYSQKFKEHVVTLLPDPGKWMDFVVTMSSSPGPKGFYLEKDVEVCDELLERRVIGSAPAHKWYHRNLGSVLFLERLLTNVLEINHQNVPEKFCCLSTLKGTDQPLLKIKEAKRLLKNPNYQISYLCISHGTEPNCDVHLIASAFPNLTEVVLHLLTAPTDDNPPIKGAYPERQLKRRGSAIPEEQDDVKNMNQDSSFKMFIEHTPHLRHLTLVVQQNRQGEWNLPLLDLIPDWKSLDTLHLVFNPQGEDILDIDEAITTEICKKVIRSIEQLCNRCSQLTAFLFEIGCEYKSDYHMVSTAVKRINNELSRPNLQIGVIYPLDWRYTSKDFGIRLSTRADPCRDEFFVDKFFASTGKTPVFNMNR